MTKVVFFDIDGTLLSFNTHTVPQSTIDAVHALRQKGIKVIIATGRLLSHIKNLDMLTFDGYITVNGSYCVDTQGQVIGKRTIPRSELESLIWYERNVLHFPFTFMLQEGTYVNYVNDTVQEVSDLIKLPNPPVKDLSTLVDEEVYQINLYVDKETEDRIMHEALASCQASRWHPIFLDVNLKGVNKSVGIDEFLRYYGIDRSQTMAFGDGGNDIEMLKHVAIGVAMGNAGDNVKAIADYVTDSVDNDGIANALRHFGLID